MRFPVSYSLLFFPAFAADKQNGLYLTSLVALSLSIYRLRLYSYVKVSKNNKMPIALLSIYTYIDG